ncbi:MAG TPA: hypothetical protein VFZ30_06215 [Acidimicrobiales bacterium]
MDEPAFRALFDAHMPRRTRSRAAVAAVAAAVVAATTGVAVLSGGSDPDPAAALTRAAETTAEVTSLRGRFTRVDQYGESHGTLAVAGDDMRIDISGTYTDGRVEGSTTVVIDDQITQVALDGSVEVSTIEVTTSACARSPRRPQPW